MAVNPLSRREVLKFGAYTTVGGVLTPGISLAQAVVTDTKGIIARAERIGVTGFCGGGALTLHFTSEYPDVAAAVPWYGHVKRTYSDAPGVDAFAIADKIKVPVLGLYGEADTGILVADVKALEQTL